jgi:hypothetical protein
VLLQAARLNQMSLNGNEFSSKATRMEKIILAIMGDIWKGLALLFELLKTLLESLKNGLKHQNMQRRAKVIIGRRLEKSYIILNL